MSKQHHLLQSYFDKISESYDRLSKRPEFRWTAPDMVLTLIAPLVKRKKRLSVLDIGIGTGQSSLYFFKRGDRITGIDLSPRMIERARRKMPHAGLHVANVEIKPPKLKLNSYDLVLAVGVLEFIRNTEKVIDWITKHIRNDGYFCFTYEEFLPRSTHQRWRVSELGKGIVKPIPQQLKLRVFRRTTGEIRQVLARCHLRILAEKRFAGYMKQQRHSVFYHAVLTQKQIAPKLGR